MLNHIAEAVIDANGVTADALDCALGLILLGLLALLVAKVRG